MRLGVGLATPDAHDDTSDHFVDTLDAVDRLLAELGDRRIVGAVSASVVVWCMCFGDRGLVEERFLEIRAVGRAFGTMSTFHNIFTLDQIGSVT